MRDAELKFPWGRVVRSPEHPSPIVPVSYDWRGVRYEWRNGPAVSSGEAFDVERLDTPRPRGVVPSGWDMIAFLAAWTRAEVVCKLTGVPVLLWLKINGLKAGRMNGWALENEPGQIWTCTAVDLDRAAVYSFGLRPGGRPAFRLSEGPWRTGYDQS